MYTNERADIRLAAAQWLGDVPWQVFSTLSFASPRIGHEPALMKFHDLYHDLADSMRTTIGYLYCMERRTKSGARVPLHFHCLLVAAKPIPTDLVKQLWYPGGGKWDNLSVVKPYDPSRSAIEYIHKQATDPDAVIDFNKHKLAQFSPSLPHRQMSPRAARRWDEQRANPSLDFAATFARADKIIARRTRHTMPARPAPIQTALCKPPVSITVVPPQHRPFTAPVTPHPAIAATNLA